MPTLLASIAGAVADSLRFRTVAVNLYRPEWDAFEIAAVQGGGTGRERLLGRLIGWEFWTPLLSERFERRGAYLIRHGEFDWSSVDEHISIPDLAATDNPDAWHPDDALMVPMRSSDGQLLGILSVDEPESGLRPSDEELEVLVAVAAHAAQAVEAAQEAVSATRHHAALEQLLSVSAELTQSRSVDSILQSVSDAIREALGFGLVVIELREAEADRYRPVAASGLELAASDLQLDVPIATFDRIFDPAFETCGCHLLTRDEALACVGAEPFSFQSSQNGRGSMAWNRHWLIVALKDRSGDTMGFIWVDDPDDRLIPSRQRLQALRLFADQAATALHSAGQFAALHEAEELQRAMIAASPIAIMALDRDGSVRSWNAAAEHMFGWSEAEVVGGLPPSVPAERLPEFRATFEQVLAGQSIMGLELSRVRRDGSSIDVSLSATPIRGSDGRIIGVLGTQVDITDRKRAAADLARQKAELEALHQTSLDLIERLEPASVLETIVARAAALLGTPSGYLYLLDEERDVLVSTVTLGSFEGRGTVQLGRGEGLAGRIWAEERAISVDDNSGSAGPRVARGSRAQAGVPLRAGGRIVGVLGVGFDDPDQRFDLPALALLARFGQLASLVLENARLYDAAQRELVDRREKERALLEATEHNRTLLNSSPVGILVVDRDRRIRSWNPAAREMFGYSDDEVIGHEPPWIPADVLPGFRARFEQQLAGESVVRAVYTDVRADGTTIDVSTSSAPMRGPDGSVTGMIATIADITDRRRAEVALARQNAELEALQETAFDLLNRHDPASMLEGIVARAGDLLGTPNGYLYLVDPGRDQLHLEVGLGLFAGHEGARLTRGSGLSGRIWKEERAIAVGDYAKGSEKDTPYADLGVHAAAGVPLRSAGEVIGVLGIAYQDPARACREPELALLSRFGQLASLALENMRLYADAQRELEERREAEGALRKSQELYRAIVESSADVIALLDLDGTALYVSPAHERVLGYRQDELIGRAVSDYVHPDDVEHAALTIAASVGGEAQRSETVTRVRHKDGNWVGMEGVTSIVRNEAGEPEMILAIARDVTERHRAAEDKAKLEEELRQAQKMEAVGRLAGGVAHDFNNLLTAINGYGDLALARLDEGSPVRRNVEEMKRAGERATALTRQLLAFSRKQVLQPKVLDLNDVVGGLEGMLARVLGEDVELATGLEPELGRTRADPGQIEQVVLNLAINARDAMPRGGRLTITTANVELDDLFVAAHPGATPGQFVQLAVSDTGDGMDRETLERVFEPFFTTKPPGQGTGLGLSTVYGIVSQTGGQIWAYSEPGRGTAFKVYLPRVWDVAAEREERRTQPALGGTETVLLVEDEAIVRSLVREMLEGTGYVVLEAADGDEAAALADEHTGAIDLLMTDVVMPGVSGQQLAARMIRERPGLRVLFTSGYTEAAIMHHGVLAPDTAFLEKPFTAVDLGRKVRELLDGHEEAADSSVRRLSPARAAGDF